jgi:5-methylcytosine-specific restriction endonuclease McrA
LFEYRQWRSGVFTRDHFTCIECGHGSNKLQAHHIIPLNVLVQKHEIINLTQAVQCDELWNINNGVTICKTCHLNLHKQKGYRYELSKC